MGKKGDVLLGEMGFLVEKMGWGWLGEFLFFFVFFSQKGTALSVERKKSLLDEN